MEKYIGTKVVNAKPMSRLCYVESRGWKLPNDENGDDEGFLIESIDAGRANTEEYEGYVSWSPRDIFEKEYRQATGMTFGDAIEALKAGEKVARKGWNGLNMYLYFKPEGTKEYEGVVYKRQAYIVMKTAQDMLVPWLASQSDMISEDWYIV